MQKLCKAIVTLGPLGYLKGSGTWATIFALPLVWMASSSFTLSFVLISLFLSALMISFPLFTTDDPGEIVADEIIGSVVALFGVYPFGWTYALGFLLFRFFDITKVCGIRSVEKLPGVAGVVMDDVVAGLYTNLLLRVCIWFFL